MAEEKGSDGARDAGGPARRALPDADEARLREGLLDLCEERGYEHLSLADLLDRADVGRESFHRGYTDLEDYFCALLTQIGEDFRQRVEQRLSECSELDQRLKAIGTLSVRFLTEDPRIAHFMAIDVQSAGERARLIYEQATGQLFDMLGNGDSEPAAGGADDRATVKAVGGAIFTQIYLALSRGEDFTELLPRLEGLSCPTWERPASPRTENLPV